MSSSYVGAPLRRQVAEQADSHCEYCLIAEAETFFGCEVDHIISEKHGGATQLDHLAYACAFCNRHKGSDIGQKKPPASVFANRGLSSTGFQTCRTRSSDALTGPGRQQDDGDVVEGFVCFDPAAEFVAVHPRHHHVGDDQGGPGLAGLL